MASGAFGRHWTVWKTAWQAESSRPGDSAGSDRQAMEFLPAVLEIQQIPPSPIGRSLLWTILAVFTAAGLWAGFGWIDIVATAQGKIIPSGYSKIIQPYEAAVIASIQVQDGQAVKQGDVLIELDSTINRADYDRTFNEYLTTKVDAARLRALIKGRLFSRHLPVLMEPTSGCNSSCYVTNWPNTTPSLKRPGILWISAWQQSNKPERIYSAWKPQYLWRLSERRSIRGCSNMRR